jgi:hypothetical protein
MIILILFISSLSAQDISPQELKDRFTSTIKDGWVENKMADSPNVKKCIDDNKITPEDLENVQAADAKQAKAVDCFNKLNLSAEELKKLETSLGLGGLKLVEGNDTKKMTEYLTKRLQRALYGENNQLLDGFVKIKRKNQATASSLKLVDQKIFVDLYEMQMGKNIVFEISKYCYRDLQYNFAQGMDKKIEAVSMIGPQTKENEVADFTDEPPKTATTSEGSKKVFEQLNPSVSDDLQHGFISGCAFTMKLLCAVYEKKPTEKRGELSCLTLKNLRAYRNTLATLQSEGYKKLWTDIASGKGFNRKVPGDQYNPNQDGQTFDDLTSLTSKDVQAAYGEDTTNVTSELKQKGCDQHPETPDCAKFFFKANEDVMIKNAETKNKMAIEFEKQKLDKITERKSLKEYLNQRGYTDLIAELETLTTPIDAFINDKVFPRFKAEKQAQFEQLAGSFERKQIKEKDTVGIKKVDNYITEIKNKKNQLSELVTFNNVVMSYLSICTDPKAKSGADCDPKAMARYTSAGRREVEGMTGEMEGSTQQYFETYSKEVTAGKGKQGSPAGFLNLVEGFLAPKK